MLSDENENYSRVGIKNKLPQQNFLKQFTVAAALGMEMSPKLVITWHFWNINWTDKDTEM